MEVIGSIEESFNNGNAPREAHMEAIGSIKEVGAYLASRGWKAPRVTLYRHIEEKKLKCNQEGIFEIATVERYARKYLKRLTLVDTTDIQGKENMIIKIQHVSAYLHSRGWLAPRETLYRHIAQAKLKRNPEGAFSIIDIEKYARKYLRPLDVINATSQDMALLFQKAMEKFYRDKAPDIINFVSGDLAKTEELKSFLNHQTIEFFKLQSSTTQGNNDE